MGVSDEGFLMKTSDIAIIAGAGFLAYYISKRRNETSLPYEIIPAAEDDPAIVIDRYKPVILNEAVRYDLEPAVIAAIIYTESRGNPNLQKYLENKGDFVYGLMQIRLTTAVLELGYNGKSADLLQPAVNIGLGSMYLKFLRDKYGSMMDAISSYNQGNPGKNNDGSYKNQGYVNAVLNLVGTYRKSFWTLFPNYFTLFNIEPLTMYEV
jgi:soluble lytic murein transglycosylase-like protein